MIRPRQIWTLCAIVQCSVHSASAYASVEKTAVPRHPAHSAAAASPLLRSLSLHDRIAQLIIARGYGDYPESNNKDYQRFYHWIHDSHLGGFIVLGKVRNGDVIGAPPFEMASFINHMQHAARTPLLVGSDFERGASMRVAQTARFPYLMAYGAAHDLTAVRQLGAATAREARTLGVNWAFAPDADVNNNPDNPIINTRSFGEDPHEVASDVEAFIEGAHSDPGNYVLVTAKHFPGHGDTSQDSHMALAQIDEPRDRMEAVELVPFRAAIAHGADAIMTGHLAVPAFEPQPLPATLSRSILSGLLRDELGFKGLVVTDALNMAGVTSLFSQGELAVRALEAGADVLLMPDDPDVCIRAITAAVRTGRISRARIDASASRVLAAKQRVGLFHQRYVNLDHISDSLEEDEMDLLAQSVADKSLTLVKDDKHLFPMQSSMDSCLVIMSEGEFSSRGQALTRSLQAAHISFQAYVTHATMPDTLLNSFATDITRCKQVYVATFITVGANRGNVALTGCLSGFLQTIVSGTAPVALISFGSPYVVRDFSSVASYLATYSVTSTSEVSVARALIGSIPIEGKLPISIPGIAKAGDGLFVPAQARPASNGSE